jgi:anti-sigma B factor antagonist
VAVQHKAHEDLRVEIAPDRERVTVRAGGEIDLSTAPAIEGPLLELLDRGFKQVVLDLQGVRFMDSSGIRVLINAHQHAEALGASLSILVGTSRIRQTLELSGAIEYLGVS